MYELCCRASAKAVKDLNSRKGAQFQVELGKDGKLQVVKGSTAKDIGGAEGKLLGAINDGNNHATINASGNTWLRADTANLPDRSRPARWKLSGSREHCREQRNWAMMWPLRSRVLFEVLSRASLRQFDYWKTRLCILGKLLTRSS
jgi:hypothetical protein